MVPHQVDHDGTAARNIYHTKLAKYLRRSHGIKLVRDATALLERAGADPEPNCACETCKELRPEPHPHIECIMVAATLLSEMTTARCPNTPRERGDEPDRAEPDEGELLGDKIERNDELLT